jgi:hypothetical protein
MSKIIRMFSKLSRIPYKVAMKQKYGFTHEDLWNVDEYLLTTIRNALMQYREDAYMVIEKDPELDKKILNIVANIDKYDPYTLRKYQDTNRALHKIFDELVDILPQLWY